ncbi:MAG: murein biosynthesis integral membrane protein MurJ [Vampirovibrionia bacterium]
MAKQNLFKVVSLIAFVTIFSKFAGFIRDLVIAGAYGASISSDAYFYAYQIPALALILLGGLGGPFHTATIAVFGKRLVDSKDNIPEHENKLLSTYLTFVFIGFSILSVVVALYALPLMKIIASSASQELQQLAADMLVIMSPVLLIGGLIGIFYGILNVYGKYFWPSLSPLIASVAIIAAVVGFGGGTGAVALALGTLIGALGMILVQLPQFFQSGFKIKPALNIKIDGLKDIGEILFPAMIGTTIGQTNVYVDMFFVSGLPEGGWTSIVYANRLLQLPIGVLLTAMLVPIFPMFTEFVAKNDMSSLKRYAHQTVISLWFISFPILVFILLFSVDGIRVLLERGQFDSGDTLMVSSALIFLSFSIIPYVARDTVTRVFYAFGDSKTPLYVGLLAIIVNAVMDYVLVAPLGVGGITLSTTIVTIFNLTLLVILLRLKIKDISLRSIIKPTVIIIFSSLLMGIFCYGINYIWNLYIPETVVYVFCKLSIIAVFGFSFYSFITILLGLEESKKIFTKVFVRVKNKL